MKITIELDESQAARLGWLRKTLAMAGTPATATEIIGMLILTVDRDALETAFAAIEALK
jgi:hypothetical protein